MRKKIKPLCFVLVTWIVASASALASESYVLLPIPPGEYEGAHATTWKVKLSVTNAGDSLAEMVASSPPVAFPIAAQSSLVDFRIGREMLWKLYDGEHVAFRLTVMADGKSDRMTEIPVVREDELLRGEALLTGIPFRDSDRLTLRMYILLTPDRVGTETIEVTLRTMLDNLPVASWRIDAIHPNVITELRYAQFPIEVGRQFSVITAGSRSLVLTTCAFGPS